MTLGDFLEIGENLTDSNEVEGGKLLSWRHISFPLKQLLLMTYLSILLSISAARLLIDYQTGLKVLVDIQAAIAIPLLRTYGEVTIEVNDDGALLKGKINFLKVLEPEVKIEWDWGFENFYAELGDIKFVPFILELNNLVLDIETQPTIILFFAIDITVLSFADLGATLLIVSLKVYKFLSFLPSLTKYFA